MLERLVAAKCPVCNGTGFTNNGLAICYRCQGKCYTACRKHEQRKNYSTNGGMKHLESARIDRKIGLIELGNILGIDPTRLGDLESGYAGATPTEEESNKIYQWIAGGK